MAYDPGHVMNSESFPEAPGGTLEIAEAVECERPAGDLRPSEGSRTFDLLMDVEMPVSVSFGRAQILLKDVLKLAAGSIVELNRTVAEPVDILINGKVIAQGEVVIVEGNFGVRIQSVISRKQRLETLD